MWWKILIIIAANPFSEGVFVVSRAWPIPPCSCFLHPNRWWIGPHASFQEFGWTMLYSRLLHHECYAPNGLKPFKINSEGAWLSMLMFLSETFETTPTRVSESASVNRAIVFIDQPGEDLVQVWAPAGPVCSIWLWVILCLILSNSHLQPFG